MLAEFFQKMSLLNGEHKRLTTNSPRIILPVHKESVMDEMLAKGLVGARCHEKNFFVDDPSSAHTMGSGSHERALSWITTNNEGEGLSKLISLIQ
jgi:hypothetical protein